MPRTPLDLRRRRAARIALYGSVVLVLAAAVGMIELLGRPPRRQASEGWIERDYAHHPAVRLLQGYARIDTSATTGDEVAGARFLADRLREAGIPSHLERLGERSANLWAIVEGERPEAVVLHSHIDVTPIEDAARWVVPPFSATIDLPWIFGRGVFDMKSLAIAQLEAFVALARSGVKPYRSVILLATGGEESGSHLGTQWILARHPELTRRFWAVLTEGGVVEARTRSDVKYWGTEFAQKRFVDLVVCGADRAQLAALGEVLRGRIETSAGLRLRPEVAGFLARYGPTRDSADLRSLLARPEDLLDDPAAYARLPAFVRSMFRSEAVPFQLAEAPGGGFELTVKLHLLPGIELAQVRDSLVPAWLTHGLATTVRELPTARHGSPVDHPLVQRLERAVEARHPGTEAGPMFLAWTATDARFFRQAGIPAFGFSPFLILSTDTFQVDAPNERIALPGFVEGVEFYTELLPSLASDI